MRLAGKSARPSAIQATFKIIGAEEGTRTPTPLRVHGPEPCASANSATSARVEASADDLAVAENSFDRCTRDIRNVPRPQFVIAERSACGVARRALAAISVCGDDTKLAPGAKGGSQVPHPRPFFGRGGRYRRSGLPRPPLASTTYIAFHSNEVVVSLSQFSHR